MMDISQIEIGPLTSSQATEISTWEYGGPWQIYNLNGESQETEHSWSINHPELGLLGFYCTGVEARVPGLNEMPQVIDVGVGLHPKYVGQGLGSRLAKSVFDHVRSHYPATSIRVVVQSWNLRSITLCKFLGFEEQGTLEVVQNEMTVDYLILTLEI